MIQALGERAKKGGRRGTAKENGRNKEEARTS